MSARTRCVKGSPFRTDTVPAASLEEQQQQEQNRKVKPGDESQVSLNRTSKVLSLI